MPVTKPSVLPQFASTATVTEPTIGEKTGGWATAQKPPAQKMNWIHKHTYLWCEWLQDITNQAFTWTANHIFNGNVSVGGAHAVTGNQTVGGTLDVNGNSDLAGVVTLSGANPAGTTAFTNQLTPLNVCKGWAHVAIGPASDGATPKIIGSFNVASAAYSGSHLLLAFASAVAAAVTWTPVGGGSTTQRNCALTATPGGSPNNFASLNAYMTSDTGCEVVARDAAGAVIDLSDTTVSGTYLTINILVFGPQ